METNFKTFGELKKGDTLYFVDYGEDLSITEVPVNGATSDGKFVSVDFEPVLNDPANNSSDILSYVSAGNSAAYGFYTTKEQALTEARQQAMASITSAAAQIGELKDRILDMSRLVDQYTEILKLC